MIIQKTVIINNKKFKHTFSDQSKYIKQVETGAIYNEAYDVINRNFTYIETDTPLSQDDLDRLKQEQPI